MPNQSLERYPPLSSGANPWNPSRPMAEFESVSRRLGRGCNQKRRSPHRTAYPCAPLFRRPRGMSSSQVGRGPSRCSVSSASAASRNAPRRPPPARRSRTGGAPMPRCPARRSPSARSHTLPRVRRCWPDALRRWRRRHRQLCRGTWANLPRPRPEAASASTCPPPCRQPHPCTVAERWTPSKLPGWRPNAGSRSMRSSGYLWSAIPVRCRSPDRPTNSKTTTRAS
mmetsp:Transcript_4507/g.17111  ORF Transcript_4507/g.17111 Transcript_4507/m.17111 type:complete len:226 (-) Transcript_4507:413-1090(-)